MLKTIITEPSIPAKFIESVDGKGATGYRILGKLQAPFFDLNGATRNGRDYSEAAEDALKTDEFKEKMENRVFFGRLGHPVTEEESLEDPAVRACVIMTDYKLNPSTNMYEATLDILDNQYGRQLKSLIDAGACMGVSTRGSGDSYESADGTEMIRNYEFENLDVVTLPAVKAARCRVLEGYDKSKYKKLESIIADATDKYVLESLKTTVEASGLPNKNALIESINNKLSSKGPETIESLTNDISMLTERLAKAEAKVKEYEESKSTESTVSETIENGNEVKVPNKSMEKLLKSSTRVIESMKSTIKAKDELLEKANEKERTYTKVINDLNEDYKNLKDSNDSLKVKYEELITTNKDLTTKVESLNKDVAKSKSLTESLNKTDANIKSLKESLNSKDESIKLLESKNAKLTESIKFIRSKYVESLAMTYGISHEELKYKTLSCKTINEIESAAKSIRESMDARRMALPDPIKLGSPIKESKFSLDDPELSRAGRIAQMTKGL